MERSAGSSERQGKQGTQRPWVFPVGTSALRRADVGHWRGQEQERERDFLWLMEQSFRSHKPSAVHKEEQSSRVVMSLIFAAGAKELYSDAWAISTERTEPHGASCHAGREETSWVTAPQRKQERASPALLHRGKEPPGLDGGTKAWLFPSLLGPAN